MFINAYKILKIEQTYDEILIKKAYKERAKENHPDKGGNNKNMQDINLAYQILVNKEERIIHDIYWGYIKQYNENRIYQDIKADNYYQINILEIIRIRRDKLINNKDLQYESICREISDNYKHEIKLKYKGLKISLWFFGLGFLVYPLLRNYGSEAIFGGILLYSAAILLLKDNLTININGKNIIIFNIKKREFQIHNIINKRKDIEMQLLNEMESSIIKYYENIKNINIDMITIRELIIYAFLMGFENTIKKSNNSIIYKDNDRYILVYLLKIKGEYDKEINNLKENIEKDMGIKISDIYLIADNNSIGIRTKFKVVIDNEIKKVIYNSRIDFFYTAKNIDPIERINNYIEKVKDFT
ncbi:MAG: J domain-containing protein [Mobilitalea sp.]